MSFNKVILQGNLTRDPEVRTMPSGASVARLSVAVNRTYNDKDGNRREEVTYVDVDAFGKVAELIGKHFSKGKPILVEGRLKLDRWEDKTTGDQKSRLGVVMESFSFVGSSGGERSGDTPARREERAASRAHGDLPAPAAAPDDGDVPF